MARMTREEAQRRYHALLLNIRSLSGDERQEMDALKTRFGFGNGKATNVRSEVRSASQAKRQEELINRPTRTLSEYEREQLQLKGRARKAKDHAEVNERALLPTLDIQGNGSASTGPLVPDTLQDGHAKSHPCAYCNAKCGQKSPVHYCNGKGCEKLHFITTDSASTGYSE